MINDQVVTNMWSKYSMNIIKYNEQVLTQLHDGCLFPLKKQVFI